MRKDNSVRRILIIDDNAAIHDDFRKVLCPVTQSDAGLDELEDSLFGEPVTASGESHPHVEYELDCALQGEEGLAKLKQAIADGRPYAMAFVDMRMPPGWDGVQTIQQLWKVDRTLQIAICTAYTDYSPDQISSALGIRDGLLMLRKPFEKAEIRHVAMMLTEKAIAQRERDALEKIVQARTAQLQHAALHDTLTGLPNRLLFNDRLQTALKRSAREPQKFAVLFVDCDRFKVINDSLGHAAGDQLLLAMAGRLQQAVRDTDLVVHGSDEQPLAARLGGDEFAILLDGIKADADAARVAERLLKTLENPYVIEGHEVHSTASIGITTNSLGYNSPEEMIRDADTAMYRAKTTGGSRFVMFDQAMHNNAVERLELENDLRHAVERGQICLFYQPIVNMRTRQLAGFEALARWSHPKRGLVSPAEFIALAEETGIIVPLGIWILEQACKQLAEWQQNHPEIATITMSVNLSRKQLAMPDLLPRIRQILSDTGVDPRFLKLEITESAMMHDADAALAVLKQIQAMNIQLHMDDFGTGYSSLSCLQQFPLDGLKIDRQFVSGIATRADHAAVLRAIVQLAHNLKIPLVAEGIETLDQIKVLDSLGCDQAQGYFFAKPMDTASATNFIKEQKTKTDAA